MFKETLKSISTLNNWVFLYARKDFQNLFDELEQKEVVHLFVDPIKRDKVKNAEGVTERKTFSGSFTLMYSSDYDGEDYETHFENNIKPILENEVEKVEDYISCEGGFTIESWSEVEVINILDYNFDGVIVTYRVAIDV